MKRNVIYKATNIESEMSVEQLIAAGYKYYCQLCDKAYKNNKKVSCCKRYLRRLK